jgi:hypothetical protein
MLGRTLLQPAPPVTFGLKAAGWLASVCRGRRRLQKAFRVRGGVAVWRGQRHVGVARRPRNSRCRNAERRAWIWRRSPSALAHPARSTGDADLRLWSADWISRQNGARYQPAHAEARWERQPSREEKAAADRQPCRTSATLQRVHSRLRRRIGCRDWLHRFSRRCCRSTSVVLADGRRNGRSLRP